MLSQSEFVDDLDHLIVTLLTKNGQKEWKCQGVRATGGERGKFPHTKLLPHLVLAGWSLIKKSADNYIVMRTSEV